MRVFVTGGSGYLGRNIIRTLLERGDTVYALARSGSSEQVIRDLGAEPVAGDVLSTDALRAGMDKCDLVIHAAADVTPGRTASAEQLSINGDGTRAVLEAARAAGVPRAVHIGTEAVLADGNPIIAADESTPIPATHAGSYSATKALAERIALSENRDGLEVVVVRPRFIWGRDDTTLLPQLVDGVRRGQFAWIGDGHYLTSTTHVANVVAGILAAAERGEPGAVYFLTDGDSVDFRNFITDLLATQGLPAPTRSIPRPLVRGLVQLGTLAARLTGDRIQLPINAQMLALIGHEVTVDDSRARREIGYTPVITREQGLAELRTP